MKALYQCAKIAQSLQRNIRPLFALWAYSVFIEVWMYLTCQQQQKTENKYTFFVKPKCVLLIGETRTQWQIFEVDFDYIR